MLTRARDRVCHAFFDLFIAGKVVVRETNCAKRKEVVAIAVLVTSCLLRSGNRLFLVSRVQDNLRVYLAIAGVS